MRARTNKRTRTKLVLLSRVFFFSSFFQFSPRTVTQAYAGSRTHALTQDDASTQADSPATLRRRGREVIAIKICFAKLFIRAPVRRKLLSPALVFAFIAISRRVESYH